MKANQAFEVSMKAIILNEKGKILLAKDDKGIWDIPGGRIEHNENINNSLKREVQEELGVDCEIQDDRPLFIWPAKGIDGTPRFIVGFSTKVNSWDFKSSDENVENGFFGKEDLNKLNLYDGVDKLKDWLTV